MRKNAKIYVAGHTGLLGSALIRRLSKESFTNIITRTHMRSDLTKQAEVERIFCKERPEYVILCAAKVGGIKANMSYPADFIYDNLAIEVNVIHLSYIYGVKKLLFFGSACSYPKASSSPIKEDCLLSGRLEPTNESYAVAKIAGIKMCEAYNRQHKTRFICAMPANTYGPNDNFDPDNSHVIPALIRRFHEAKVEDQKSIKIWGSGNQIRDFIYVDDLADANLFLMRKYNGSDIINIGTGNGVSIKKLVYIIKDITGYKGKIIFDRSRPEGVSSKVLDIKRLKSLGWKPRILLDRGIGETYEWYLANMA